MSQTSTSHTQWIQHAVAAAKAGNPSVAKIQLQKAAEAAPGDPAVWLWMGWLADSPASAVQCLELARSDERFQKIADAGIDFAKALAEFQLELQEEVVVETWAEEPANDLVETSPVVSPAEAVEEVAAVVETLQQEDSAEPAIDSDSWERSTSNDDCESAISESVEQVSESGAATGEENDSTPDSPTDDSEADATVQPVVDASDDFQTEAALEETVLAESDDSDLECDQPESAGSDKTNAGEAYASDAAQAAATQVETALMESANELWQTTENVADSEPGTPEPAAHEPESGQQFWKPASSENRAAAVSGPASAQVTGAETPSEVFVDESEGDFTFASGEDVEFKRFVPIRSKPIANNDNTNTQIENQPQDQWLGQSPDNAPAAPVWRKAQSDWFSVDAPSDPEPDQAVPSLETQVPFPAADSPVTENSEVIVTPEVRSGGNEQPPTLPPSATKKSDAATSSETTVATTQHEHATAPASTHRVTASDVWQTAAIEKSDLSESPAIHMPVYEPAVAPLPARTKALSTSLEEVALQSPVNNSAGFSTAEPPGTPFLAGNAAANPLDGKTVLVVDDSPTVRKLVSITLEKRGYKVASAFDGVAAIKEIAAHNPALILMDVNMPRLDGYQLCKLVKKHETTCDIPVLMLSGTDGMFDRLRGRLVGCAGHVTKPFTPEVLIEAVEQHMTQGKEV